MPAVQIRGMVETDEMEAVPLSSPNGTPTTDPGQYTHGLHGVRLGLDNLTSNGLYGTILVLCVLVLVVRLASRGNAHMRHLFSLAADADRQAYWTRDSNAWWPRVKTHLLYAPLRHKRHNREIQLSAAVNVGTIPSRLHTLILVVFLVSNVVYLCLLDYGNPSGASLTAELRGRSGHLGTLNMLALVLFAGRNNPLVRLLRISFDTFNLFHRWLGRIVVLEIVVHTLAWAANVHAAKGWDGIGAALAQKPFLQVGLAGTVAMLLILVQSPSAVRHAYYETFLALHQLLAFAAVLATYMHAKTGPLPQLPFAILIMIIWGYDRFVRLARFAWRNFAWRRSGAGGGARVTRAVVEALPGEACRVTFHLPRAWTPPPGAHVYAYLPSVSFWMSHPFSVAWSTAPTDADADADAPHTPGSEKAAAADAVLPPAPLTAHTVSLVMAARTGMTRHLYLRAAAAPSQTLNIAGFLEGPYGALESLHSYGSLVLFAGGIGITHLLPHLRDLLARCHPPAARTVAARRVLLVWTVRDPRQLEWVRPYMNALLRMPARREVLRIQIFITRPGSARDVQSASERVLMFPGRPRPRVIVAEEFAQRVGAMSVGVCGPGALADDVRDAARAVSGRGKVDFWEEAFTW